MSYTETKRFIPLTYDQIDSIIIDELKETYKINSDSAFRDDELLTSIELILKYYMTIQDFEEWKYH